MSSQIKNIENILLKADNAENTKCKRYEHLHKIKCIEQPNYSPDLQPIVISSVNKESNKIDIKSNKNYKIK